MNGEYYRSRKIIINIIEILINSNIYISLAAVILTVETQIQMGMKPQWHPYLFIIFFATLFEYNLHNLVTVTTNKDALNAEKYNWVKKNIKFFFLIVFTSLIGLITMIFLAKKSVLITLFPIALITLFYSLPIFGNKKTIFRLRQIPYLKIFLIAFVWSTATIFLPIIQSSDLFDKVHIMTMVVERFLFVFAITIPFDIRDIETDKLAGLKTIPSKLNKNKSLIISYICLLLFFFISFFHYQKSNYLFSIIPLSISTLTTFIVIKSKKIRNLPYYHYGFLDGTLILQGVLVIISYYLNLYLFQK